MSDELLDIVDRDDRVIGQKLRSEIYAKKKSNFRAVNAFLINDNGELWIPRRSANKPSFPSCLDASVSGHVKSGETYEQALSREAMEELRIDVGLMPYQELGKLDPYNNGTAAFTKVYLFKSNNIPDYDRKEFQEYFRLTPQALLELIDSGVACKSDLPIMIRMLFIKEI